METKYYNYRIEYFFNHGTHGFSNSITVSSVNQIKATEKATQEISDCYGSKMMKRFSLKEPVKL